MKAEELSERLLDFSARIGKVVDALPGRGIANCKFSIDGFVMKAEELSERLLDFSARIGKVVDALPETRLGRHIAGQLVRCGTSPAPNYEEGCAAESRADFIHKLRICLKELRETRSWVRLIIKAELIPEMKMTPLLEECHQLCNILGKSVLTAREKKS